MRQANIKVRHPLNVPGKYFVDEECTDCSLCQDLQPLVFKRDNEYGYSYVYRQPVTPEENALSRQLVVECPMDAIGETGDQDNWQKLPASSWRRS